MGASFSIAATSLKKVFDRKIIFQNLSLVLDRPKTLAITGENGSGKSTLLKTLAAVSQPTAGEIRFQHGTARLEPETVFQHIGFVAPYLTLYDELSGLENVRFALSAKSKGLSLPRIEELFEYFMIAHAKHQPLRTYSSGMAQRLKFIQALAGEPLALFLDEPTLTLDEKGKQLFWDAIHRLKPTTPILIATNDRDDHQHADERLSVADYKPVKR
jgi:heme exporter protein A